MPFIAAKCTQCNAMLTLDDCREKSTCMFCGAVFFTKDSLSRGQKEAAATNTPPPAAPPSYNYSYQYNTSSTSTAKKTHNKRNGVFFLVAIAAILVVSFIVWRSCQPKDDTPTDGNPAVTSSRHGLNVRVRTDWFNMTLTEGHIRPAGQGFGNIPAPAAGWRLAAIKIRLENPTLIDCDMSIVNDFFIETGGSRYEMENTGGNYQTTTLAEHDLFYNMFIIPPGETLHGWIVFYIRASAGRISFTFFYEEWEFGDGDIALHVKHHYNFPLEAG
ncbi:MAG: hypothetical protein FWH03_04800 [Firmicutes bacterium]|nr:hypothetical protein [Bacillota bacterium]